jgi:acyl-coenzyme A synthetase/AMP-(fatty) acid ligase
VAFIKDEEMPRTGSGKVLHRLVRQRFPQGSDE